jgi:CBS domain-containing protein
MNVAEIMKKSVVTVNSSATIEQAVAISSIADVSGLPVVDDAGILVGVITEHDIIRAMLPTYKDLLASDEAMLSGTLLQDRALEIRNMPVESIMTRNVITATEDEKVLKVASTMILKSIKRLPVVRAGKPVGIVSRVDIVHALMCGPSGCRI